MWSSKKTEPCRDNGSQRTDIRPMPRQSLMDLNTTKVETEIGNYPREYGEPIVIFALLKKIVNAVNNGTESIYDGFCSGGLEIKSKTISFQLTVTYKGNPYKMLVHYHPYPEDTNFLHAKIFPHPKGDDDNIKLMNTKIHTWLKNNMDKLLYPPYPSISETQKIFAKLKGEITS